MKFRRGAEASTGDLSLDEASAINKLKVLTLGDVLKTDRGFHLKIQELE